MNSLRKIEQLLAGAALMYGLTVSAAFATCTSGVSGTTASVTCSQNTDILTLSQSGGYWTHAGPVFGSSPDDWDSIESGVQSVPAGGTINANFPAGGRLNIGSGAVAASALNGAVSVSNPQGTNLQVYLQSSASGTGATYTVDDLPGLTTVGQLSFSDANSAGLELIVSTSSAFDRVYVLSVCACDSLLVQGNAGDDEVLLGNSGDAQQIQGPVTILNTNAFTTVTINDVGDATGRAVAVTSTGVSGLAPAAISWSYYDVGDITLVMGVGSDMVQVQSLEDPFGASSLMLQGSNGADIVNIGNAGSVQAINAPILIANSGAYSSVVVDDSADPIARSVNFTADAVSGLAPAWIGWVQNDLQSVTTRLGNGNDTIHVLGTPSSIFNALLASTIELGNGNDECYITGSGLGRGANTINGGTGDDLFVVSAVPTSVASLAIFGGTELTADKLVYTSGPATGAFPGNGTLVPSDPNARAIDYNSIEQFSVNDWIFASGFE